MSSVTTPAIVGITSSLGRFRVLAERAVAGSLIVGSLAWLLAATHATWCDPLIDFGQQLYLAWRVAEGDVLYRDLAYYNGPLSVYINAGVFRLFGVSLNVLVGLNLVVLGLLLATLYAMFRRIGSRWGAVTVCVMFLWMFAFSQLTSTANYNYVCPYSHEAVHGLLLGLWGLGCLWSLRSVARAVDPVCHDSAETVPEIPNRTGLLIAAASGLALGLCLLTKAEVSLGALAAAAVTWITLLYDNPCLRRRAALLLSCFAASLILPPLAAFAALACAMPWRQAAVGAIGSWGPMFSPAIRHLKFFQDGMGTSDVAGNLGRLLTYAAAIVTIVTALGTWTFLSRRLPLALRLVVVVVATALMAALAWQRPLLWLSAARALPAVMALLAVGALWEYRRAATSPLLRASILERLSLVVFAGFLLGKMLLNARVWHYGFVLAMPAFLLGTAALWDFLPRAWFARLSDRAVFRAGIVPFLISWICCAWHVQQTFRAGPEISVADGCDAFRSNAPQAEAVQAAATLIRQVASPNDTVLVFPEGAMLNYLTRRRSPTPYTNFMPSDVNYYGEEAMLSAIATSPPRWIVLAPKNLAHFGVTLGHDFLARTTQWLDSHYRPWRYVTGQHGEYTITIFVPVETLPLGDPF